MICARVGIARKVEGRQWTLYIVLGESPFGPLSFNPSKVDAPPMTSSPTREEAAAADEAVANLAQQLSRLTIRLSGGGGAEGLQWHPETPLNRNNVLLDKSTTAELNIVTDEAREVSALVDDVKEKLKDRNLNPKLKSYWTEEGKQLWQVVSERNSETISDANRCLAVRLLDYMAQDTGSSFEDVWKRYLQNTWYKKSTSGELCALFNVGDLPIVNVTPASRRHDGDVDYDAAYNTYITGPTKLLDWIRHPVGMKASADDYCTTDIYYAAFSVRWHHLYVQAFPMLSYTNLNIQHSLEAVRMSDFDKYKGLDGKDKAEKEYIKSVRKHLDGVLLQVKQQIFDKGKVRILAEVHDKLVSLKHQFLETWRKVPDPGKTGKSQPFKCLSRKKPVSAASTDDYDQFEFKVNLETTRIIHDWFETKLLPSILEREPTIATIQLPPMEEKQSDYFKSIACAVDSMIRFDTDPSGWWCMKWLCNGATEIVTLGGKPQSSLIEWGAGGPKLLRPRRNGKRSALAEKVPGRHIAFHMGDNIHLPAFQDWYTRTDEIPSGRNTRAFTGPLCHIKLNSKATEEKDVFGLLTIKELFAQRLLTRVCQLVRLLKDHNAFQENEWDLRQGVDVEDELDDDDVDDALERNPVIKEAMCMASGNHPFIQPLYFKNNGQFQPNQRRVCFSKGIIELFYSFQMGYDHRPAFLKKKKRT
ncbi:hypothetical protein GNI_119170 [Gregarina niphandrodes]|uniref:Uncharacterized protein n=1 Tax=Gregarina niphandrodes TaxID=110365 RepID=A0A023B2J2_GRENI|nr:hypothetical protein GNI_119170 [Gregarina niphandrodes]EZG55048.1 hypothetical protein GNI_119170 [Gregarina niphandrodes]|eukprot:XP_011131815.1 hypothetical protein GNI_119170 [Gregarina niphandrodes]